MNEMNTQPPEWAMEAAKEICEINEAMEGREGSVATILSRHFPQPLPVSGETEFPQGMGELHAKTLDVLADARPKDQNVQETLRCAARHIRQLETQLTTERAAREIAEDAMEGLKSELSAFRGIEETPAKVMARLQAAESKSGDVAQLRDACKAAVPLLHCTGTPCAHCLCIAALASVPANPPQVDATLEAIVQELRAMSRRLGEFQYEGIKANDLADAISAHDRLERQINSCHVLLTPSRHEKLLAIESAHARKSQPGVKPDVWIQLAALAIRNTVNLNGGQNVVGQTELSEIIKTHFSAAESAAPGENWEESRLREAWEMGFRLAVSYGDNYIHFTGAQRETQWAKAYGILLDARKTEGAK